MRISVLLVSWNAVEDLKITLDSLREQTFTDFETILVDNGSEDGAAEEVRKNYPFVDLIALDENTGFATANNIAAKKAKGELLFIVNTDTELPKNLLEVLELAERKNPEFDILSCQMISIFDRNMVDCKGMTFLRSLRAEMIDIAKPVDPAEQPYEIFGATGGAMLIRRKVYDTIGLFDDEFFVNNEDVDFVLRAIGAEFRTLYVPDAKVYHKRSPNEARYPDIMLYYIQRNFELAAYKNLPVTIWLSHGWIHALYNGYQFAKWGLRGKAKIILKAKLDAIKMFPKLERKPVSDKLIRKILGKRKL